MQTTPYNSPETSFLTPKISTKFNGVIPTGAPNRGKVGSNWRFLKPKSRYISETVKYGDIVTIEH